MSLAIRVAFIVGLAALPGRVFGQVHIDQPTKITRITGRVVDSTGAGLPQTKVVVRVAGTRQAVAEAQTDDRGDFSLADIDAAQAYEIRFEERGFETAKIDLKSRGASGGDLDLGKVVLVVSYERGYFIAPTPEPSSSASSPIKTTLCNLIKEPNRFHGGYFQVRAAIHPSGIDTPVLLYDSSCSPALLLYTSYGKELDPFDKTLDNLGDPRLRQGLSRGRIVEATVTGKFELWLVASGKSVLSFTLLSVSDVTEKVPPSK